MTFVAASRRGACQGPTHAARGSADGARTGQTVTEEVELPFMDSFRCDLPDTQRS
jgi:hypothetical protein